MSVGIRACLVVILLLPSLARALPADIVGFGNSITCWDCNDGSYLVWLEDWGYIDSAEVASQGVSANLTSDVLARVEDWIDLGNTADVLILLAGTPDTYLHVDGWQRRDYDPLETVRNIESLINLVLTETSIVPILVAPPPVLDPCANSFPVPTCSEIDTRLADLAGRLDTLANDNGVLFLDLYAAFMNDANWGIDPPDPDSLYLDGLHPRFGTGDFLIADLLVPIIETALIPEPSTAVLLGSGLLALAHWRRGRRKAA